jgi:pimeloyl-ACP methyl ester carboxylesterase
MDYGPTSQSMKRVLIIFVSILAIWIIFAQSCMTFGSADGQMKQRFLKKGVELKTATAKIQGRNLHYAITGRDSFPTLVFLHGTPGSWNAFADYMHDSALLETYRMISIDRPGFGYSDFGKSEPLAKQSELIGELMLQLNNQKPVILVGHSLGGPLIIKLTGEEFLPVSGLVMISASVDPAEEKPEKWRPMLFKTPLNLLVPGAFRPSNLELWYLKNDLEQLKSDFPKVRCPVYFIHGDKDTWVRPENVEYARKLLINAERIEEYPLRDGNHFIPWTRYNEIKDILLRLSEKL